MKHITWLALPLALVALACSNDNDNDNDNDAASSSSSGGSAVSSSSSSGEAGSGSSGGSSGGGSSGGGSENCTAARAEALQEQSSVSAGAVSVVSSATGAGTLLYIDASAGGSGPSATMPRIYVDLAASARVEVSDVAARESNDWDLALKRTNVFSNGGDGGPGQGAVQVVTKAFADVTAADANDLQTEAFFDDDCQLSMRTYADGSTDPFTFRSELSGWYDYDTTGGSHAVVPVDHTYVVRGGKGALYKVRFEGFSATPEGMAGETTGRFLLRVAALE